MANHKLKISSWLCILFSLGALIHQAWFLIFAPTPDPSIAQWAAHYRITSTIEIGFISAIGISLSSLLLIRQTFLRGLVMGAFCLFILWKLHFSELGLYFDRMFGDGSFSAAVSGWWRLHADSIWIDMLSFITLFGAGLSAFYGSYFIRKQ